MDADLSELLTATDATKRNHLARKLADTGDHAILLALIELIQRPELADQRGSLIHALKRFDCAPYIAVLACVVANGNWEAANEATLRMEAIQSASGEEVVRSRTTLEQATARPGLEPWRAALLSELLLKFE